MAAGAGAPRGLVLLLAALAGTSGKAPAECPATCYKQTCDHWVDTLGHSCEMLETTDMCDCSGCWCGEPGSAHGVDRGGHGARAEASPEIVPPKSDQNFNCLDSLTEWEERWSEEKRAWCCAEEGLGCPAEREVADDAGRPPFDCLIGVADWRGRWEGDKQRWCCSHRGLGCAAATRAAKQPAPKPAPASSTSVPTTAAPTKTTTSSTTRTSTVPSTTRTTTSVSSFTSTVSSKTATSTTPVASTTSTTPTPSKSSTSTSSTTPTPSKSSTSTSSTTLRAASVTSSSSAVAATAALSAAAAPPPGKAPTTPLPNRTSSAEPTTAPKDPGSATSDPAPAEATDDPATEESRVELPAWWLLLGVVPGGGRGRFSEEQRWAFGVNRDGEQLDTDRFALAAQAAHAAFCTGLPGGPEDPPPWWHLFGIQPARYAKREGRYLNVTFSKQQQEHFGVDAGGRAADEGRLGAALEALRAAHAGKGELPDWWILGGVEPAGGGSGAQPAFSRAQQHRFGVSEGGEVEDWERFGSATRSLWAPAASAPAGGGAVPWWLAAGVQPVSFARADGAFSGVGFSREQQDAFGVDVEGIPTDKLLFTAVTRAIREAAARGDAALPPWWARQGVAPRGWIKRAGRPPAPLFSEAQEAYFGVDQRGSVVDRGRLLATTEGKAPPAWWLLLGVQPRRAGTHGTKAAFSSLQQERYGVDAAGRVVDHPRFDAATRALRVSGVLGPDPHLEQTPWWITNNVMPSSFRKDSGWYLQVTFSTRQQEEFGVGAGGEVANAVRHEFALRTLQKARAKGESLSHGGMLSAWQREMELNSTTSTTSATSATSTSSSQTSTTPPSSAAASGAAAQPAAGPAEDQGRGEEAGGAAAPPAAEGPAALGASAFEAAAAAAAAVEDEAFAVELARLLRNDQRMRDDALQKLGFTPEAGDPDFPSIGGFDPSLLGVASAYEGGGGEPAARAGGEEPEKRAGTEDSSTHARFLEKPTGHHTAVLEVACQSAADALKQSRQAAWITNVKVRCGELAQAQAAQDRCFLAGAGAITEADRKVRWLAERGCRRTASSPRSPGLLGMLGTLANSTWERVLEIRNQSDSIYEEAVASAIRDSALQGPAAAEVDRHGIEAVASLMCEDAVALDVTRAVQFKTAQLTRACTKLAETESGDGLGARAASACLEAGFSALAAVGKDVSSCFADACRAFVAASGVRRLAVDTHEAVRRFKAVAGNSTLPAGCETVARASSEGLEGSLQVLMSAVVANATSRGSAAADALASPGKPRRVNDKFLVRFGDAAVQPNPVASAGAVALTGLLVMMAAACGAALQLRSRTLRYHTVRAMPGSQTLIAE